MGDENPLTCTIHEIHAALMPSDSRSDWASESAAATAAAKQAEIKCQCFDKRRGVFLMEKVSVILK